MRPPVPAVRRAAAFARTVSLAVAAASALAWALQAQAQAQAQPATGAASAQRNRPPPMRVAAPKAEAKPAWAELTPAQKTALEPLAGSWNQLTEAHKRKWLAVSQKYPTMPPGEQARLHTRMAEWAALSPQQRSQARLNFAETSKLPVDDKKAKWEAYQALSPEEKRKLAAGAKAAKPAAPPTAAALEPVPQEKLTKVPKPRKENPRASRNTVVPNEVDHNTLLPQPGAIPGNP
jgi:hypothetical protein